MARQCRERVYGSAAPAMLEIEGLSVERHDPKTGITFRLDVPALEIRAGDRIGVMGDSGSGKTTLLESLGLLSWPNSISRFDIALDHDGTLVNLLQPILARDSNALSTIRATGIGFILQDGGLLPYLTVLENALLAAELSRGRLNVNRARIEEAAHAMGLAEFLDRMPAELSGGQRQRAAVLRALAPGAKLLFCDEPTASLDPSTSFDVMTLIAESAETFGASVVIVSHDQPLLRQFGYRLYRVHVEAYDQLRHATLMLEIPE